MSDDLKYLNDQIERLNRGELTEAGFIQQVRDRLGYTREEIRDVMRNLRKKR